MKNVAASSISLILIALMGCNEITITTSDSVTESELEDFFRKHKVEGNKAVALKKRSVAGESYLATIHGYPTNFSVCEHLIAPYNEDLSLSSLPGTYYCEVLD
jgi:hypothetical protein